MPKVSIIIPTYNCAHFLREAIESALNQTYQHIEIIVVDDGSSDGTKELLKGYQHGYPDKFRFYCQDNRGSSAARNLGIKNAEGEFIALLDSDDYWSSQKLKKQMTLFEEDPQIAFSFTNACILKNGHMTGNYVRADESELIKGELFYDLFFRNFIPFSSVVFKKSIINEIGLLDETLWSIQDFEWLLRVIRHYKIRYIDECLVTYRVHNTNISKHMEIRHKEGLEVLKRTIAQYPELKQKLGKRLIRLLADKYFYFGYALFDKNHIKESREQFLNAIRTDPCYSYKPFLYFGMGLLPSSSIKNLRKWKQRLQNLLFFKAKSLKSV